MTLFGWLTVALWVWMGISSPQTSARLFCAFMVIGTLVWGTGSLHG